MQNFFERFFVAVQFVQLMNWQNNSCKFVQKIVQAISKRITCTQSFWVLSNALEIVLHISGIYRWIIILADTNFFQQLVLILEAEIIRHQPTTFLSNFVRTLWHYHSMFGQTYSAKVCT